jgi:hypothetical protein
MARQVRREKGTFSPKEVGVDSVDASGRKDEAGGVEVSGGETELAA